MEECVESLYDLSNEMYRIADKHGFELKICVHYGDYKSGVSATAYGLVSYYGKPMNEACRMLKGLEFGQVSVSLGFWKKLCNTVTDDSLLQIMKDDLQQDIYPDEEIYAKGAIHCQAPNEGQAGVDKM